jgi:zinc/manganese transport system substrate-binding protein
MTWKGMAAVLVGAVVLLAGCQKAPAGAAGAGPGARTIVVTYSVLGAVVKDLAGGSFNVVVSIPNGLDPHEWDPSARDVETLTHADLVVQNGLGLEGGMERALAQAKAAGARFFTASDHVSVRRVGQGEGIPSGDRDQAVGAQDPHLWMDPVAMKGVVTALADELSLDFGVDLSADAERVRKELDDLDAAVTAKVSALPTEKRLLVTGHESLGYLAQRYGFTLVGALVPSLSTEAETSASQLASLVKLVKARHVPVIFTELGTPPAVTAALARDAGAKSVTLVTHALPPDGSYATFMMNLAATIVDALAGS